MPAPTGPTNPILQKAIQELRGRGFKEGSPFLLKLVDELARPERARRDVNVSSIERFATKGDTVVVPGKLLADGLITKSVTVAAFSASVAAKKKVEAAGGKLISIDQLLKSNPKGSGVKIIC